MNILRDGWLVKAIAAITVIVAAGIGFALTQIPRANEAITPTSAAQTGETDSPTTPWALQSRFSVANSTVAATPKEASETAEPNPVSGGLAQIEPIIRNSITKAAARVPAVANTPTATKSTKSATRVGAGVTASAKSAQAPAAAAEAPKAAVAARTQVAAPAPAASSSAVAAQTPAAPAQPRAVTYAPRTLYFGGNAVPYIIGNMSMTAAPATGASTWGGITNYSNTSGGNTHFIGHSPGSFAPFLRMGVGSQITVTDAAGRPKTYTVYQAVAVDDHAVSANGTNYWSAITGIGGGQRITIQTCITSTENWILFAR